MTLTDTQLGELAGAIFRGYCEAFREAEAAGYGGEHLAAQMHGVTAVMTVHVRAFLEGVGIEGDDMREAAERAFAEARQMLRDCVAARDFDLANIRPVGSA